MPKFTFTNYVRTPSIPCSTLVRLELTVLLCGLRPADGTEKFRLLKINLNAQRPSSMYIFIEY